MMLPRHGERPGSTSVPPIERPTPVRSTMRRNHRSVLDRGRWAAFALVAALATILAACTGTPGASRTPTPTTAPSSRAQGSADGPSTISVTSRTPTSTAEQSGTVVPFRTVPAGSATGRRIGLVSPNSSDPLGKAVTDSISGQLKVAGADLITCDPGDDPALVLDCARRLATEKVDGWIIVQPGDLGRSLCDVGPAKVPLITIAASPIGCQTTQVGADDVQAGFLVGRELAGLPRNLSDCGRASFLIFDDPADGTVSADRVAGIRAGFAAVCPGLADHVRIVDAGTQDRAYDAFTATLATVPADTDIFVAAVNDNAALGVVAATPDARAARVKVAAVGADQRARCEMAANPRWFGDAALFPDRYGDVAVPVLLDALAGRSVPGNIYVQTTFVTADDLTAFYPVADCPAQ